MAEPLSAGSRDVSRPGGRSDWWPPVPVRPPITLWRREETGPDRELHTVGLQGLLRMVVIAAVVLREQILA